MKKFVVLFFIFCHTCFAYSQQNIDKYEDLKKLIKYEDYLNFKIKFDEYETELKSNNDFNKLAEIYAFTLQLFELNEIFKKEDVQQKLDYINLNKIKLSKKEQIDFECTLIEFFLVSNQKYDEGLKICNKNLDVDDINQKLYFYRFKSTFENYLGYSQAIKTAYKTLQIARDTFGENDPRLLTYFLDILKLNLLGDDNNSTKIGTSALKIVFDNKLEGTEIEAIFFYYLGQDAMGKGNYTDWYSYTNKCKLNLEKNGDDSSFGLYNHCLLNLAQIYIKLSEFELAKMYLEHIKKYIDEITYGDNEIESGYYWNMGDYFFFQNKYNEAKNYYEKAFAKGENQVQIEFKLIICDYLLEKNVVKTIYSLEQFNLKNKTDISSEFIYLLKYNLGDNKSSQKILFEILEKLKDNNSKYLHLLSDFERERIFKSFNRCFEFLNTYLLDNKSKFLNQYVDFRFYSKSLLFSNSFKLNNVDDKSNELFKELKSNIIKINNSVESKIVNSEVVETLKRRNREIEKLLSLNNNPLTPFTSKSLNNNLKNNQAYIEIIRINKQSRNAIIAPYIEKVFTDSISYGAIIIKKNTAPKFILIDDSNQLEKQFTSSFKSKILDKQEDTESYHLLFEKIDNELKDVKKIYLVADGIYNSINIESIYNPNRKQYLIDYLKIQPIQNVRAITDDKKDFKVGMNTKTILFGNPDFDLLITDAKADKFSLDRGLDNTVIDKIKSSVKIGRLNGTQKEIETLDTILRDSKASVELFFKANATEDNLKNIQSPDILHIATHGYFLFNDDTSRTKQSIANLVNDNYKNDSYLKSGLLLAGAQDTLNGKQPESKNNGILTAEEAKSLNLKDTELVVLSACETGLGDNLVGEGVIGLQRAFMIAGARSVIMSLWSVSDEKTQELMTLFYTNWIKNNMSKEEALYQAKIEMKKLYPQPYYWAGFVLLE
jgi:CHAT domain-containing protein